MGDPIGGAETAAALDNQAARLHYARSMHLDGTHFQGRMGLLLMAAAALAVYVAARTAVDALARGPDGSPGWRAVGHWIPIAMVAVGAVLLRQPAIAVSVIFASSVGSLSLVLGLTAYLSGPIAAPPRWRRVWLFLVPATALLLVIGFWGHFTPYHALCLLLEGFLILFVWLDASADGRETGSPQPVLAMAGASASGRSALVRGLELLLAVALSGVGAWVALLGTMHLSQDVHGFTPGIVAMVLLAPILVLPMISTGGLLAHRGQVGAAATTCVGLVLLNVCALLPLTIFLWYHAPDVPWMQVTLSTPPAGLRTQAPAPDVAPATGPATAEAEETATGGDVASQIKPLVYPIAVWRVDTVLLLLLGLLLMPVALDRWPLARGVGMALVVAYALYLSSVTLIGLMT